MIASIQGWRSSSGSLRSSARRREFTPSGTPSRTRTDSQPQRGPDLGHGATEVPIPGPQPTQTGGIIWEASSSGSHPGERRFVKLHRRPGPIEGRPSRRLPNVTGSRSRAGDRVAVRAVSNATAHAIAQRGQGGHTNGPREIGSTPDCPSAKWLGHHCPNETVRCSGLWSVRDVVRRAYRHNAASIFLASFPKCSRAQKATISSTAAADSGMSPVPYRGLYRSADCLAA